MRFENNSKSKIDPNLINTIKVLDNNKIDYWLCHGTLLGIIRDRDLIPWDHDIDIAVWDSTGLREKLKNLMLQNNYKPKEKYLIEDDLLTFSKEGGREVDINFYKVKSSKNSEDIAYVKWFIPKNNIFKLIEALSSASKYDGKYKILIKILTPFESFFKKLKFFLVRKNYFYKNIGYTQPLKLLKKFKKIKFKEIFVTIPQLSEEYLNFVYGKDWKNPVKKFNWIKDSPSTKEV